ncbi:hypothetical protein [Bacillus sp. RAR_GA_16]|nr:hypothetical protein [Bacillus sp. RAR_GA_16]MCA0173981.1 hypothetical protein [Bacillus sp. RAR_GA_16]
MENILLVVLLMISGIYFSDYLTVLYHHFLTFLLLFYIYIEDANDSFLY